jgi:uncharacterized protein YqjF (DUF2071 family)
VTPFLLEDLRTPVGPALPWFTSFPETNVRTYVVGPDGREGLWFFSLDAARLEPVLVARSTYALPYMWSAMTVERDGPVVATAAAGGGRARPRRRRPSPWRSATGWGPEQLGAFDHYLTARWQLYTTLGPVLARSNVEHEPWPLHRAAARQLDGNLIETAGLPVSKGRAGGATGRQACGPGSAPCDRSDEPDCLALRRRGVPVAHLVRACGRGSLTLPAILVRPCPSTTTSRCSGRSATPDPPHHGSAQRHHDRRRATARGPDDVDGGWPTRPGIRARCCGYRERVGCTARRPVYG